MALHPARRNLLLYALALVLVQSGYLYYRYRASAIDLNASAEVKGATTTRIRPISNWPDLAPYPILKETAPKFNARQYALYDVDSNMFLFDQDAETAVPLASTTKIMTTTIVLEGITDLQEVYTVKTEAANINGSTAGLKTGEKMTVENILYCALLNSGNDAALSLADLVSQKKNLDQNSSASPLSWSDSMAAFVKLMTAKATELDLKSFSFKDPSGLDDNNVGSAKDLAKLAAYALKNKTFRQVTSTPEKVAVSTDGLLSHQLKNSNRLLSEQQYPGIIGVKTGFTPIAGHNLVAADTRNGHTVIAVVLNTYESTITASAAVARAMLDFTWQNVEWK